jgi:hypothetical protein
MILHILLLLLREGEKSGSSQVCALSPFSHDWKTPEDWGGLSRYIFSLHLTETSCKDLVIDLQNII